MKDLSTAEINALIEDQMNILLNNEDFASMENWCLFSGYVRAMLNLEAITHAQFSGYLQLYSKQVARKAYGGAA